RPAREVHGARCEIVALPGRKRSKQVELKRLLNDVRPSTHQTETPESERQNRPERDRADLHALFKIVEQSRDFIDEARRISGILVTATNNALGIEDARTCSFDTNDRRDTEP
ncbi:MAG: hypothetical protein ACHBMF_05070, partial [Chromatiales bacterium]